MHTHTHTLICTQTYANMIAHTFTQTHCLTHMYTMAHTHACVGQCPGCPLGIRTGHYQYKNPMRDNLCRYLVSMFECRMRVGVGWNNRAAADTIKALIYGNYSYPIRHHTNLSCSPTASKIHGSHLSPSKNPPSLPYSKLDSRPTYLLRLMARLLWC